MNKDEKEIANSIIALIMFEDLAKLEELLSKDEVRNYISKLQCNDSVVLKLRAYKSGAKKTLHRLMNILPTDVLAAKFTPLPKPLVFARMQRNANSLLFLKVPESIVHKIFTYVYSERDGIAEKELLEAAQGTLKLKL